MACDGTKKSSSHMAMDRGTYVPRLRLESSAMTVAELKPKQEVKVPDGECYNMEFKKHGVCLVINNKTFEDQSEPRKGTDRDEANLVETWRYLGYHVEVRRNMSHGEIKSIFDKVDDFLSGVDQKTDEKSKLAHDSFVCCLLSHGDTSCIISSDSKKIQIQYLEKSVGASKKLLEKPKIFFIQACQGEEFGCGIVESKVGVKKPLVSDSNVLIPDRSDIYISYATVQGNLAIRDPEKGSWYIGVVCKTLCEESKQNTLNQLQLLINKQVTQDKDKLYTVKDKGKVYMVKEDSKDTKYKQQPTGSNQLTKNVHFFYGETN